MPHNHASNQPLNQQDINNIFKNFDSLIVRDKLNCLPKRRRDVLLEIWQNKDIEEIAQKTSTHRTTISQHIRAILQDFELYAGIKKYVGGTRISSKVSYLILNELKERFSDEASLFLKSYGNKLKTKTELYVRRTDLEKIYYDFLERPGAFLRIKAPRLMGKKVFLKQVLKNFNNNYTIIFLSFSSVPMNSLEAFFKGLCIAVGDELLGDKFELEQSFKNYWRDQLPPQYNISQYLQKYLLPKVDNQDIILILDDMDIVFENSEIANEFSKQLRNWNNEAKRGTRYSHLWQKLHTVILYSSDLYAQFDINNSPLVNVGSTIELPEFNLEEIQQLAQQQGLTWNQEQVKKVINLVGGHPHLLNMTIECVQTRNILLDDLDEKKLIKIYSFNNHLREQLRLLEKSEDLIETFKDILNTSESIYLSPTQSFKLQGLGLIKKSEKDNNFKIHCQLYKEYFQTHLINQSVPINNEKIS